MLFVNPCQGPLKPIKLTEQGQVTKITIHAFYTPQMSEPNFQEDKTVATLKKRFKDCEVEFVWNEVKGAKDNACGVTMTAQTDTNAIFGFSELSEKGGGLSSLVPKCCDGLLGTIDEDGWVTTDEYMQDQLIIFMALAKGISKIQTGPLTLHTKTAIYFAEKMTKAKFRVFRKDGAQNQSIDVSTGTNLLFNLSLTIN